MLSATGGTDAVSTHSRPKAAGFHAHKFQQEVGRFNTQPPEGGWPFLNNGKIAISCFNTQPPEGGWAVDKS